VAGKEKRLDSPPARRARTFRVLLALRTVIRKLSTFLASSILPSLNFPSHLYAICNWRLVGCLSVFLEARRQPTAERGRHPPEDAFWEIHAEEEPMNNPVELKQCSGSHIGRKHMGLAVVRLSFIAAFTLGWGLVWSVPASATASHQTQVFTFPVVDDTFLNQCPGGEDMLLNGNIHLIIHTTQDARGGSHQAIQQSGVFSAIGLTTGTQYVWIQISGNVVNQNSVAPFEFTQTVSSRIVGQGPNNGQLLKDVAHVTINANGEVSASFENFTSECN
jgi:hypothetical protein